MVTSWTVLAACIALTACKGAATNPVAEEKCVPINETKTEEWCATTKEECETQLKSILMKDLANRCPIPPCMGYGADVSCKQDGVCEKVPNQGKPHFVATETSTCK